MRLLLPVLLLLLAGCSDPPDKSALLRSVIAAPVTAFDGSETRVLSGVVQSAETSQLSFEVAGIVASVNVNLGDTIAKGDVLATIEPRVFELAVKQRKGQLSEVQARLSEAQTDFNRKQQLIDSGAVSQAELDVAETQLSSLRDQVDIAQAQLELAEEELADSTLIAPYAGTIAERHVEPSQRITPGQPAFTIQGESGVEVAVLMPENLVNYIKAGDDVTVSVSAISAQGLAGQVFEVGSRAQSANAFPVTVTLDNSPAQIQPGMSAEVQFRYQRNAQQSAFVVPLGAVGAGPDNQHYVWQLQPGDQQNAYTVHKVRVTVLAMEKDTARIQGDLSTDTRVVRSGVGFLEAGQQVLLANGNHRLFNE